MSKQMPIRALWALPIAILLSPLGACAASDDGSRTPLPAGPITEQPSAPENQAGEGRIRDVTKLCEAMSPQEVNAVMQMPNMNFVKSAPYVSDPSDWVCVYYTEDRLGASSSVTIRAKPGGTYCEAPIGVTAEEMRIPDLGDEACGHGNDISVRTGRWGISTFARWSQTYDRIPYVGPDVAQTRLREMMRTLLSRLDLD